MPKVNLGEFTFDTDSHFLYCGEKELEAEPKVLEVLAYLYLHRDRYISLQELHEQVWVGRIVSDTAVRGTIKKLRTLLDDSDITDPRYIKSQSKRGYKLICSVNAYVSGVAAHSIHNSADLESGVWEIAGGYADVIAQPASSFRLPVLAISVFCGAALAGLGLMWQQNVSVAEVVDSTHQIAEVIPTVGGEKRSLALSPDGTYLAFIGRHNLSEPWQIYLMQRRTRELRVISVAIAQPSKLFFDGNNALFVINQMLGNSSIYRLKLESGSQPTTSEPVLSLPMIAHMSPGQQDEDWLINAVEKGHNTVMLYRWNANANILQRIQARNSAVDHIYLSVYSPAKTLLASMVLNGLEHWLEIQDVQSKRIVYSKPTAGLVDKLEWQDEESLIELGVKGINLISLSAGSQQLLSDDSEEKITDFSISKDRKQLFVLRNAYSTEEEFSEIELGTGQPTGRIINTFSGMRSINYTGQEQVFFATVKQQDQRLLVKYDQANGSKKTLFSTDQRLELLEHHPEKDALLLQVGRQLVVVSVQTGLVEVVSSSQSYLDAHAAFSQNGDSVFFGQLVAGAWELHQFERSTQLSTRVVSGFRSLRQTAEGYVAADVKGQLFVLDAEFNLVNQLSYSINTEFISRWYVRGQRLIWTDFDFATTWLKQLDLNSGEFKQVNFPFEKMRPRFAVNHEGNRAIFYSQGARISNLSVIELADLSLRQEL
ncbi:DNA-binding winged helix-turn-helix (wHTH) protein [Rheinheimera pacifica]|uniref:winged helix-turn-helix domain-containing protein n=1 Tax=Rheinheimera pacifica TaxID=173990 RepID=UPI00285F6EE2|nr:winged helix-turn-helix domain-containing protein [Rheinheimera pacifica]MDR6985066.1 DNA-binding winged helix-turn-helix (wHTH) protein [Rheinheimera pacifica]